MKKATKKYIIENIVDLLDYGDIGFEKNVVGTASEHGTLKDLKKQGYDVSRNHSSDVKGLPDFTLIWKQVLVLIEHKRVSKNSYADGSFRL